MSILNFFGYFGKVLSRKPHKGWTALVAVFGWTQFHPN
jgi:hypothetical protein